MIKMFSHKGLEDFFYDGTKKGNQAQHSQKLADILDRLDAAKRHDRYDISRIRSSSTKWGNERIKDCKSFRELENHF